MIGLHSFNSLDVKKYRTLGSLILVCLLVGYIHFPEDKNIRICRMDLCKLQMVHDVSLH